MTENSARGAERVRQMTALRAVVDQAVREAGAAQAQLQDATGRFDAVSEQVIGVVGGSAQAVDKQLVETLREANQNTKNAVVALAAVRSSAAML